MVLQADKVDEMMGFLQRLLSLHGNGHEIDMAEALNAALPEASLYFAAPLVD